MSNTSNLLSIQTKYYCSGHLNLYDSATCQILATQAAAGRHLQIITVEDNSAKVRLCEDGYEAWLPKNELQQLKVATTPYAPLSVPRAEIERRLPAIVTFAQTAMKQPNYYLWGGTVAPNYDCSGLIQAAFANAGIWLPRDSFQQAAFTQPVPVAELAMGDLVFFASESKINHVALYLGEGYYIHSSGKDIGRNGIAIDYLSEHGDRVSQSYYQQFCQAGRVMESYRCL